jgi:uncharacterized protein YndB with AHSA1/START domain
MARSGSSVVIEVDAPREAVFRTIADPTTYPDWLVGARAIRSVDDDWPEEGSEFRHVIGFPPLLVPGSTTSHGVEPGRCLELRAGMGPFGAAMVRFELSDTATGGTRIEVIERFVAGPAHWTTRFAGPIVSALVWGRNALSLDELADLLGRHVVSGPR